jgi:ubiquinol-cytochrome c reductase cytochrome b subunit
MLAAILILFTLPSLDKSEIKSPRLRNIINIFYILFIFNFLFLGFLGGSPAEEPYILLSRISTALYFMHFLIFVPISTLLEKKIKILFFSNLK